MKTKVETGESASVLGILGSLKEKHRDMSTNWTFCVIEQETWHAVLHKVLCGWETKHSHEEKISKPNTANRIHCGWPEGPNTQEVESSI